MKATNGLWAGMSTLERCKLREVLCRLVQVHPAIDARVPMQAWLEMVDLPQEMKARGLRPAFGPLATMRNKRILLKAIREEDEDTLETFRVRQSGLSALLCLAISHR